MQRYVPGNLPAAAEWSTAQKPALIDHEADYNIPRLWCARDVYGKPTAIFRALTDAERGVVCRRRDELALGCAPFAPAERDQVADCISAMLDGFRSLRHEDLEKAIMGVDGLCRLLAAFPLWAIEQGCLAIQGGAATLDGEKLSKKYPPNDSEIRGVIAEIVKPYSEKRDATMALLAAPVDVRPVDEPKPTPAELKEKHGPDFGLAGSTTAPAVVETQIPKIDASRYSPEDLERLASRLQRGAA